MKLNFSPSKVAFIDYETQSNCDLTTVHKFSSHPSTKALTCAVKVNGEMLRFGPYIDSDAKAKLASIAEQCTLVAHNAPFDAAIHERVLGLPPAEWYDTLPVARLAGFPGKLDDLSKIITGRGKDPNGKRLIDLLCVLGKRQPPVVGPAHKLLLDYNVRDVEELEAIYERIKGFSEPAVMQVDRDVNDRGMPVNKAFLQRIAELYEANTAKCRVELTEQIGNVNPGSPKQMVEMMRANGFDVPNINKVTYKNLMEKPEDFFVGDSDFDAAFEFVQEVLRLRNEVVRVGRGKLDAALEALDTDDRLREQLVYYGAHTGRWAGRKLQPHNMPAALHLHDGAMQQLITDPSEAQLLRTVEESEKKVGVHIATSDVLNSTLRHIVQAENLIYADYNAVELRGAAWVAGESKMLDLLAAGQSVYLDYGERIFRRKITKQDEQYGFCKQLVLGCIYGMSGLKFEHLCKLRNVKTRTLREAGLDVREAVKLFRQNYSRISGVWKEYDVAVKSAVGGAPSYAGKVHFAMSGSDLHATLPSGRKLVYRNARIEMKIPAYAYIYGFDLEPKPTVTYDKSTGSKVGFLYGSRMCENAVQAVCRDFLAEALVRAEQAGFKPCLHVHDEIVCEAPQSRLKELCELMSDPPAWAKDFPLRVEGCSGQVWSKFTRSYAKCDALNGVVV